MAATAEGPAKKRPLGATGIEVTPIGLGAWQFSEGRGMGGSWWPALQPEVVDAIVKAALDGGIDWFDTAEVYGWGASERALARALRAAGVGDGEVRIATKWWPVMRGAGSIRATIGERSRCLDGLPIELYQVHQPFALASVGAQMDAMADLVEAGSIRAVGVSNFSASAMRRAHEALVRRGLVLASNQVRYSLLHRAIERDGTLETAKELGVTIIAWSPLEQGVLTGKFHRDPALAASAGFMRRQFVGLGKGRLERSRPLVEALEGIAADHGATPSQVALAWLIGWSGETVVAIPGASKARHAEESAGAMAVELTRAELDRIDEVSRSVA